MKDIIDARCYCRETHELFLKPGWYEWIRTTRLPNIRRALGTYKMGGKSKYIPVPSDYDINSVAYLIDKEGEEVDLPEFTERHYNEQFCSTSNAHTHSCSSSPLPRKNNTTMSSKSPKRSPTKPTRVKFDTPSGGSVTSLTASILEMTLDAQLSEVDPEECDDAIYAEVGADNQCGIILKRLGEVKVEKGKSWMSAMQVIKTLESKELNERMLEGQAEFVKVDVGGMMKKAVLFKTPLSYTRTHADMKSAACIADATFGKHKNRRNALEGAVLPAEDGKVFKKTLVILPELEVMDPEEKPQTYSNKYFNPTEDGRVPEDGHLNAAVSFKAGDDTTRFFKFGSTKVPLPTAYIMAQLAIEGTKEAIKKGATRAGKNLDYDAYLTAQKDLENKMKDDSEDEDN